jgi:hypothetical protein
MMILTLRDDVVVVVRILHNHNDERRNRTRRMMGNEQFIPQNMYGYESNRVGNKVLNDSHDDNEKLIKIFIIWKSFSLRKNERLPNMKKLILIDVYSDRLQV